LCVLYNIFYREICYIWGAYCALSGPIAGLRGGQGQRAGDGKRGGDGNGGEVGAGRGEDASLHRGASEEGKEVRKFDPRCEMLLYTLMQVR